jgi:hypothetical protein
MEAGANPPFFVVNPGRSGSKAIAAALDVAPGCVCLHEPKPALISEATRWRNGELPDEHLIAMLAETRRWDPGTTYGETNNKLALIIPLLNRAFPDCRFVWLVRDGREVVHSYVRRGAHTPAERKSEKPWKRWRAQGDLVGAVPPDRWGEMDSFERCCWQWDWVNGLIAEGLAAVGPERWRRVRLEDLAGQLGDVASFLGLDGDGLTLTRVNEGKSRAGEPRKIPSWSEWDDDQRAKFERWCADLMDECYPEWRDRSGAWALPPAATVAT